jgi:tetratricopeptide (TPR) repeat protein
MNVVDEAIQQRWSAFEKTYKAADDLPAWLRERAWSGVQPESDSEDVLPDEKSDKGRAHLEQFAKLLREGKSGPALELAEKAPAGELSEGSRAFLRAVALRRLGRRDEALEACAKACSLEPRCLPARRLRIALETERKSVPELIEECRLVVADFPKEPGPYVDLAAFLLRDGNPEQARSLVRGAIDAGVPAGTLEATEQLVARAIHGPVWSKSYEYKSEHYTVTSDISQKLCFDAAGVLEKFYTKFNLHLRHVPKKEKHIFRVYLFSGRAGYEAYTKALNGAEIKNTAGMYSPVVKQLLIWNLPNSESILETIRHEGFHQYLDDLTDDPPRWLNEGLATYYEGSKLVKGSWSDGDIRAEQVAVLAKKPLVPLGRFLRIPDADFLDPKAVDLSYAESWAFVHFLLSNGPENRKLFDRMLDALIGGARGSAAVDQVFPDAVTARLEPEFAAYVRGLH